MTIKLLTPEQHSVLDELQKQYPNLTFQNVGFQYIDRRKFTPDENTADAKVTEILKSSIKDFVRFDNFILDKKNEVRVRFQYDYSSSFTGVGYIYLRELLNGFDKKEK
jgi:hypothetical protein